MKKIIISIAILTLITGCEADSKTKVKPKENESKVYKVSKGEIKPIKSKGFIIDIAPQNQKTVIAIKNDTVKKNQAYQIVLTFNKKDDIPVSYDVTTVANSKEDIVTNLDLDFDTIKTVEFKIDKTINPTKGG